jgi:hypothetical protein
MEVVAQEVNIYLMILYAAWTVHFAGNLHKYFDELFCLRYFL